MARTNRYRRQIYNRVDYINRKARKVEATFGLDSEQYQRYVNATTAALPPGTYRLTQTGRLTISKSKENLQELKLGQLKPLTKLPTAEHSMKIAKQSLAKNQLRAAGAENITEADITAEATSISDEQALQELAARSFIQNMENTKGKLKYDESVRADLATSGAKTYSELKEIIERGQKNAEKRAKKTEYQRRYRAAQGREEVNRKQREYRARNRDEINRKQREYRARRKHQDIAVMPRKQRGSM